MLAGISINALHLKDGRTRKTKDIGERKIKYFVGQLPPTHMVFTNAFLHLFINTVSMINHIPEIRRQQRLTLDKFVHARWKSEIEIGKLGQFD